jgi:hypothetical protein
VQRAFKGIPAWGEEKLVAAEQDGGLAAVSARLRALAAELSGSMGDMISAAEAELIEGEYPPDCDQRGLRVRNSGFGSRLT